MYFFSLMWLGVELRFPSWILLLVLLTIWSCSLLQECWACRTVSPLHDKRKWVTAILECLLVHSIPAVFSNKLFFEVTKCSQLFFSNLWKKCAVAVCSLACCLFLLQPWRRGWILKSWCPAWWWEVFWCLVGKPFLALGLLLSPWEQHKSSHYVFLGI